MLSFWGGRSLDRLDSIGSPIEPDTLGCLWCLVPKSKWRRSHLDQHAFSENYYSTWEEELCTIFSLEINLRLKLYLKAVMAAMTQMAASHNDSMNIDLTKILRDIHASYTSEMCKNVVNFTNKVFYI